MRPASAIAHLPFLGEVFPGVESDFFAEAKMLRAIVTGRLERGEIDQAEHDQIIVDLDDSLGAE